MKRLKDATQPASFWTCLSSVGIASWDKARILAGLASIPLWETMNPSSFPAGTITLTLFFFANSEIASVEGPGIVSARLKFFMSSV